MIQEISQLLKQSKLSYAYNSKEFIPGTTPVYYSGPYWDENEISAAIESLLYGKWLSSGEKVQEFEQAFSKKFNSKHSVMVNSGSSANLVLLAACKKYFNWQDGDEIVVSVVGFPTTIAPIIQNNLVPNFVDIEMNTLNFDLNKIKITPKTKAIFLSPVLGNPCDIDELLQICKTHNLQLILDNCDSLGSKWRDHYLNEYAIASSCSFYPAHHISTGEGGMVSSNNLAIIKIARSIAWWGRDCSCVGAENLLSDGICKNRFGPWLANYDGNIDHKYLFTNIGYNLKPLDLQGAIGLVQLEKFDEISRKRKESKERLSELFFKYTNTGIPLVYLKTNPCWFGTPIICKDKDSKQKLVTYLEENKIQTRNYFAGNILLHPGYEHLDEFNKYKEANKVLDQVFFIGASPHYSDAVFDYVEEVLKKYYINECTPCSSMVERDTVAVEISVRF